MGPTCYSTSSNSRSYSEHQSRLGIASLDPLIHRLLDQGLSHATRAVYLSGWRRYQHFCLKCNVMPLPIIEQTQVAFAAYLSQSVTAGTVRSYLSAIRFYQIQTGLPDLSSPPKLSYILKGIQKKSLGHSCAQRLPITPSLLTQIHTLWSQQLRSYDKVMLWAAFCLGFFGFVRSGEFTSTSTRNPDECTLSVADVSVDSRLNPQLLTVLIYRSKTDQSGSGSRLYLGRAGNILCPISAVLSYLAIRPSTLFIFQDGTPLSRSKLITILRNSLSQLGVEATKFSGHSFCIGAASAAAKQDWATHLLRH